MFPAHVLCLRFHCLSNVPIVLLFTLFIPTTLCDCLDLKAAVCVFFACPSVSALYEQDDFVFYYQRIINRCLRRFTTILHRWHQLEQAKFFIRNISGLFARGTRDNMRVQTPLLIVFLILTGKRNYLLLNSLSFADFIALQNPNAI